MPRVYPIQKRCTSALMYCLSIHCIQIHLNDEDICSFGKPGNRLEKA
jgi:hypothetical protein